MIICTRRLEFDAAHRLVNHEGKCRMLHGHRYVVEVTFTNVLANGLKSEKQNKKTKKCCSNNLDEVGRVVDFGEVKQIFGRWIDKNLDHNTILNHQDQELGKKIAAITGQKIYYLKVNPTAENIAQHLLKEVCPKIFANRPFKCVKIKIYETPNCWAECECGNKKSSTDFETNSEI